VTLTSSQASSFMSAVSSRDLVAPLTACLLLGGPMSSMTAIAGRFLSSILTNVDGGRVSVGDVATGMSDEDSEANATLKT
jgi:hypothetical protein